MMPFSPSLSRKHVVSKFKLYEYGPNLIKHHVCSENPSMKKLSLSVVLFEQGVIKTYQKFGQFSDILMKFDF